MSNEKNRGKEDLVRQKSFFFPEIIEKQARDDIAKGKFRQAKDGFKELCKRDKEKYLPELLKCYHGMASQMVQNGQLSDAAQIVENIKTISGDRSEGSLDILIAIKKKDYDAVARIYAGLLSQGKDVATIKESPLVADALVVAFREFPQLKSSCPAIYEELCALRQALEDVSAERYEEAWLKVRGIGVHSIFSNWKLFVKGLVAFYKKDDRKALEAFARLPSDTVLHHIAQPYMAILDGKAIDQKTINESLVQKMCIVAGYPELVPVLPQADSLWKTGRYSDSYGHIRKNMKSFPAGGSDIAGILTRFYFNSIHHLSSKEAMRYLENLPEKNIVVSSEDALEKVLIYKARSLFFEKDCMDEEDDNDCAQSWEYFLEAHTEAFGSNNKLASLVYSHVGVMFAAEELQEPPLFPWMPVNKNKDCLRNARLAEHYFNKSISMDKDNKDACMGLLKVYEKAQNRSKLNKLLDRLITLFPDDAAILLRAGISCVERKSYIKGIKYLERAARLDPLDSTIKDHLAPSYLAAARAFFDKGQVKEGRELYENALKNGNSNPLDFNRGYAYIYARWSVLESKIKNDDAAGEKFHLAREKAERLLSLLYFTLLISRCYGMPDDYIRKLSKEVEQEWRLPPTPENAVALVMIYRYIDIFGVAWLKSEKNKIDQYAFDASDKPCSRTDALGIISFALFEKQTKKLGDVYIKKMLQNDRDDPLFQYLKYQSQAMNQSRPPGKENVNELKRILHLAEKRNDVELARELRKKIKIVEELVEVGDTFNFGSPLDGEEEENMEVLEKLFEELHRKMGGKGRKNR